MSSPDLAILRQVLEIPTAPFREEGIAEYVRRWSEGLPLGFERDGAGNVLLRYSRGRDAGPTWVFAAHMDHPGFVTGRQAGRSVRAQFRGSVRKEYMLGSRARLFAPGGEVTATVASRRGVPGTNWWACRLNLDAPADVPAGTIGMWDFPAVRIRGSRLASRGCDDQAGTAAVVCALDRLARQKKPARAIGLLTRAEEVGAIGAAAACRDGTIPREAIVVAIEASKAQPTARLGDGVVIRVGDSVRTFTDRVTVHMARVAADLRRHSPSFRHVRQLMPGGMCEATLYCAWGYATGALCMPLGNYHNMAPSGRIAPERIDLRDFRSLVDLLAALATCRSQPRNADKIVVRRFTDLLNQRRKYL